MRKYLFIKNNNKKLYLNIALTLILILIIYIISFYININQKYFLINDSKINYYVIPEDKQGEKVKFIDKKSVNNLSLLDKNNSSSNKITDYDLEYTIQLFSDNDYKKIENYLEKLLNLKSEIISSDEIYIFSINSQIGIDYFLTYQNFNSKIEAMNFCKQLSFIKNCIIIYSNNNNF
tara:strand:+ start:226 stop:756 length:531 start_codon:yes stop_codon:yes gene_type:complete